MSSAERLLGALSEVFSDSEIEVDAALIDRMIDNLAPLAADDVVTAMVGTDETFTGLWTGRDGMRQAWSDWLDTFERVRFSAVEEFEIIGDNVLTAGRQVGTTRVGGVELEQPSAAVWKFRGDELVRVEFHLDREQARASAAEPA
jgi:ketosteroid isomerase-like protein